MGTYKGSICPKHPEHEGLRHAGNGQCAGCARERIAEWRAKNKAYMKQYAKNMRHSKKSAVVAHYGGQCEMCGIDDLEVMTVDHLWGDGAKHRKAVPAPRILDWLIDNNFPPGFRVLCFNCNHKVHQAHKEANIIPLSLGTLQREISKWADVNFPGRDATSVHNKLKQEMEEWAKNPDDAEEFADVMILVLDWMQLKGVNAQEAINAKMKINVKRNWIFDSTNRTWQHKE